MTSTTRTSLRLLALLSTMAAPAWANGVVHIPEPSSGMASPYNGWSDPGAGGGWFHTSSAAILDQGITFGDDLSIVPTIDGLSFVMRPSSTSSSAKIFEFVGNEIQLSNGVNTWVALGSGVDGELFVNNEVVTGFLTLRDPFGNLGAPYSNGTYPYLSLGVGEISFGDGITASDTNLTRVAPGVLQINGQTIVTQNALANYVTLDGTQTLTNKSINAGQLTGSVTAAKGGTGLTSYTAGDLLYANGTSSLGKLAAASSGNVLLSGTSPSWGKVGLTTHVNGTLPVANGGTGATSLTGILKGNGTGAVTTLAAPVGALVGTTDTQTLSNKNLADATFTGAIQAENSALNFGGSGSISRTGSTELYVGGGDTTVIGGNLVHLQTQSVAIGSAYGGEVLVSSIADNDGFHNLHIEAGEGAVIVGAGAKSADDLLIVGNGTAYPPAASNAVKVRRNGAMRAAGVVESKVGFRTPKMGDIEMGLFTAGPNPATLNDGLRYSAE
jgi:hypothetical protein